MRMVAKGLYFRLGVVVVCVNRTVVHWYAGLHSWLTARKLAKRLKAREQPPIGARTLGTSSSQGRKPHGRQHRRGHTLSTKHQ